MELIVISSTKLKIMLSADDMNKYALGADIDYADSKTRQAFRSILEEAREKTGFDAESEKIYIQLYPSKKGGCEVYITKIDDNADSEHSELPKKFSEHKTAYKPPERSSGIIPAPKRHMPKERTRAYSFSNCENMILVCRRLLTMGWKSHSSAFSTDDGRFFIILKDKALGESSKADKLAFIPEYGASENHSLLMKHLCEHGKCICPSQAVEKLGIL